MAQIIHHFATDPGSFDDDKSAAAIKTVSTIQIRASANPGPGLSPKGAERIEFTPRLAEACQCKIPAAIATVHTNRHGAGRAEACGMMV